MDAGSEHACARVGGGGELQECRERVVAVRRHGRTREHAREPLDDARVHERPVRLARTRDRRQRPQTARFQRLHLPAVVLLALPLILAIAVVTTTTTTPRAPRARGAPREEVCEDGDGARARELGGGGRVVRGERRERAEREVAVRGQRAGRGGRAAQERHERGRGARGAERGARGGARGERGERGDTRARERRAQARGLLAQVAREALAAHDRVVPRVVAHRRQQPQRPFPERRLALQVTRVVTKRKRRGVVGV